MLEVAEARETVLRFANRLAPVVTPLGPAALGRVLAEDLLADCDSPPFAKALMDGFAVRSADGDRPRRVVEEVAAGAVPTRAVGAGEAAAIYSGAPVPDGADAVVMKERTAFLPDGRVRIDGAIKPGQNVLDRGREMTAGDVILPAGTVLTPAALGLAAAVGRSSASLYPAPRVGVLATGNELVGVDGVPGPGQIRNSNGSMLAAQSARAGAVVRDLGIGRDDAEELRRLAYDGLTTSDVLLLAGGVSAGKLDLVPDVLRSLGVEAHFHKVRMKPGKPLLFGTLGQKLVFGLPGNPVSSFVCFELFVRPALSKLAGHAEVGPQTLALPLTGPLAVTNDRPTFHPARLDGMQVHPLPWFGSADLRGLLAADALIVLPPGSVALEIGKMVDVIGL
jgi:molybdopterin molybdotransferase